MKIFLLIAMGFSFFTCSGCVNAVEHTATGLKNTHSAPKAVLCNQTKVNQWFGFDELANKAKCSKIQDYKIAQYTCSIEKNAFGADFDAMHIETKQRSIFLYSTLEKCQQAKEIWQSNAP